MDSTLRQTVSSAVLGAVLWLLPFSVLAVLGAISGRELPPLWMFVGAALVGAVAAMRASIDQYRPVSLTVEIAVALLGALGAVWVLFHDPKFAIAPLIASQVAAMFVARRQRERQRRRGRQTLDA